MTNEAPVFIFYNRVYSSFTIELLVKSVILEAANVPLSVKMMVSSVFFANVYSEHKISICCNLEGKKPFHNIERDLKVINSA